MSAQRRFFYRVVRTGQTPHGEVRYEIMWSFVGVDIVYLWGVFDAQGRGRPDGDRAVGEIVSALNQREARNQAMRDRRARKAAGADA